MFVDGVSVRDYSLTQLRSSIGYIPQETFSSAIHSPRTLLSASKTPNDPRSKPRPKLPDSQKMLKVFRTALKRWSANAA